MESDKRDIVISQIRAGHDAISALNALNDDQISKALRVLAMAVLEHSNEILGANSLDLQKIDSSDYRYDRLKLTRERLEDISKGISSVAMLPSPLGRMLGWDVRSNGMVIRRVSVPLGVVGVIYEARPNVTLDVFALCFKSGNICLLKGSKDAYDTNKAIVDIIKKALMDLQINPNVVMLLPPEHEATDILITTTEWVDLVIPRGGSGLIKSVRSNAKVPVIETGAGICHTYFDESGDVAMGAEIIDNAKTRRVTVCNALDTLLVHEKRLKDLPALCRALIDSKVKIVADDRAMDALKGHYPNELLQRGCVEDDAHTEYLSYAMSIFTVKDLSAAVQHINMVGSKHSETIITTDSDAATFFQKEVDASCVYVNLPTSFTDGGQFGLGAEIGISTQKLHARGPMGLEALTTYKWLINGNGQVREK